MSWNASQFVTVIYNDGPKGDAMTDVQPTSPRYEDSFSFRMDASVDWQYEGDPCDITNNKRYEEYNEGKVGVPILELPMFQREGPAYRLSEQNVRGAVSQVYAVKLPKTTTRGTADIRTASLEDIFLFELSLRLEGQGTCTFPKVQWGRSYHDQTHADKLSKALSFVCRHDHTIPRYNGDWVDIRDVMKAKITIFPYTDPELFLAVIMQNEKSRFKVSMPVYQSFDDVDCRRLVLPRIFLRCVQGHSVSASKGQGMVPITPANVHKFPEVYHGCQYKDVRAIRDSGTLLAGGPHRIRQAAHFALTIPKHNQDVTSGFRLNAPVVISFDLKKYVMDHPDDGDVFLASNKVVSVFNDIDTQYLTSCDDKGQDQLWFTLGSPEKLAMLKKAMMGKPWGSDDPEPEVIPPRPMKPKYDVDLEESDEDAPMPDASGATASSSGPVSHERLTGYPTGENTLQSFLTASLSLISRTCRRQTLVN